MKFVFICVVAIIPVKSLTQTSIIQQSSFELNELNEIQLDLYNTYVNDTHFLNPLLISINPISETIDSGVVYINLDEYFHCEWIRFKTCNNDYINDYNYAWFGAILDTFTDNSCHSGSFNLIFDDSVAIGHISIDSCSYEIFDLTDGILLLLKTNLDMGPEFNDDRDTTNITGGWPPPIFDQFDCQKNTTKILIFYTEAAESRMPNIKQIAKLGIEQLNRIIQNSNIDENIVLLDILSLNFNETSTGGLASVRILNDISDFSSNSNVNTLRTNYNADICFLITDDVYKDQTMHIKGRVVKEGPSSFENAFGLVSVSYASNSHYTLAHEIMHLYGCRHEITADPEGTAHGYQFRTGRLATGKKRFTLMHQINKNQIRIEHISNPDVNYGKYSITGEANSNNSAQVENHKETIRSFYPDQTEFYGVLEIEYPEECHLEGIAYAQGYCGASPYLYNFAISIDGINWNIVSGNSSSTLNFTHIIPKNGEIFSTLFIKVTITDSNNNIIVLHRSCKAICRSTNWIPPSNN